MDRATIESAGDTIMQTLGMLPEGVWAAVLAVIAVAVAVVAHSITIAVIRRATATRPFARSLLGPMEGPLRLALMLFALNVAITGAPLDPDLIEILSRVVQLAFIGLVLAHFGTLNGATPADGDLDGDTDVDLQDLATLLAAFGTACP